MDIIISEFNINVEGIKVPSTPLPATPLYRNLDQATAREVQRYQKRVRKLNYPELITRPDIAQALSKLSEFSQNPSKQNMEAAEHMMCYLIRTNYRSIEFYGGSSNTNSQTFFASSDASFVDDSETRCSSSGVSFQIFNEMIHWKLIKQKTITTSSTKAQLLALTAIA